MLQNEFLESFTLAMILPECAYARFSFSVKLFLLVMVLKIIVVHMEPLMFTGAVYNDT